MPFADKIIRTFLVGVLAASPGLAQSDVPHCGIERRSGERAEFEIIMHQDSAAFVLWYYEIPEDQIRAYGVTRPYLPPRLTFQFYYGNNLGRSVGLSLEHFFYEGENRRLFNGTSIEIIGGTRLNLVNSLRNSHNFPVSPFGRRSAECFEAIHQSGSYAVNIFGEDQNRPALVFSGRVPLRNAMRRAERIVRRELAKAGTGQCRFRPHMMPIS